LSRGRRKVRRTRAEIEQERRELLEKTQREIDAIAAEFHAKLPRGQAKGTGAVCARYRSRFQDSIADQVRTLFEAAHQLGLFIPRELVFFDMAVRGWKDRRPGLTALRQAIKQKQFDVFLVFTTSRLFRRTYKAPQFVEEELVERGIRGVFVKSHLDTADGDNWRTTFQLFAAMDEAMVRMYAEHVRAAHEGLFLRGMVHGSLPLGYTGEVVPGEFTKRKRPRRKIIVHPETAPWIERLFRWFVGDRLTLDEIARRLNDTRDAPAPAKSLTGWWTHALVRKHLMLKAYRGHWTYGAAQTKWSSDKDYAQRVPREKPLKSGQFEELRIVADELWYAAQKRLAENSTRSGRNPKDGERHRQPNLLRQLFVCPEHNRPLVVGGPHGSIVFCPICRALPAESRPLFTHLNRTLALRLTCEKLAELVRLDEPLVDQIVLACQREAETAQRPDPEKEAQLRTKLEKIAKTIEFNRRNPGDTQEELEQTEKLLKQLRRERAGIEADLSTLAAAKKHAIAPPSTEQVRQVLTELHTVLTTAATSLTDAQLGAVRRVIELLTGGRIELAQRGERKAQRGWLQGRFTVRLLSFLVERVTGVQTLGNEAGTEVVIDYREPPEFVARSEKAKELYDQGLMNAQIAKKLGFARNYVTVLLKHWFESRGMEMPDGRTRRATLRQKHLEPPLYERIAEEVMALVRQQKLLQEIAVTLRVDRNTVTSAIRWWHESQGLPVPDGRTRHKELRLPR
jgi:DNA invertase Pin-like site-specific DNA recombinase/DNA-binding CsgD family transcriptional regulator